MFVIPDNFAQRASQSCDAAGRSGIERLFTALTHLYFTFLLSAQ
jgi:hypothetical protein